jgi:hypothetical protein
MQNVTTNEAGRVTSVLREVAASLAVLQHIPTGRRELVAALQALDDLDRPELGEALEVLESLESAVATAGTRASGGGGGAWRAAGLQAGAAAGRNADDDIVPGSALGTGQGQGAASLQDRLRAQARSVVRALQAEPGIAEDVLGIPPDALQPAVASALVSPSVVLTAKVSPQLAVVAAATPPSAAPGVAAFAESWRGLQEVIARRMVTTSTQARDAALETRNKQARIQAAGREVELLREELAAQRAARDAAASKLDRSLTELRAAVSGVTSGAQAELRSTLAEREGRLTSMGSGHGATAASLAATLAAMEADAAATRRAHADAEATQTKRRLRLSNDIEAAVHAYDTDMLELDAAVAACAALVAADAAAQRDLSQYYAKVSPPSPSVGLHPLVLYAWQHFSIAKLTHRRPLHAPHAARRSTLSWPASP